MTFIILFDDDPNANPAIRSRHMADHLAFLERNAERIRAAGPLMAPGEPPTGGLWIVDAEDEAAVEALVREDPFWPTGLRRGVRILAWRRVFADGARLIEPG